MKAIVISAVLAFATLFSVAECKKPNSEPKPPSTVLRTEIGDGAWIVGDEIAPGVWQLQGTWPTENYAPNCVWFVTPAKITPSPTKEPSYRDGGPLIIVLHKGEAFTTLDCGKWIMTP